VPSAQADVRQVPATIARPDYAATGNPGRHRLVDLQDPGRLQRMQKACDIASAVLARVARMSAVGLSGLLASMSLMTYETQIAQAGVREMAVAQMTRCGRLPASLLGSRRSAASFAH